MCTYVRVCVRACVDIRVYACMLGVLVSTALGADDDVAVWTRIVSSLGVLHRRPRLLKRTLTRNDASLNSASEPMIRNKVTWRLARRAPTHPADLFEAVADLY